MHSLKVHGISIRTPAITVLSVLALLAAGCGEPLDNKGDKPYNILLISIDTLRADHLGAYGCTSVETPNIDKLAREGVLFSNAYTPCPITLPAHASLLTGVYPAFHNVRNNGIATARPSLTFLQEVLRNNGYATGAVIGSLVLDSGFGLDQGFDTYDDEIVQSDRDVSTFFFPERRAEEVTSRAYAFLKQQGLNGKPFFLWVHYFDPHGVYAPPGRFADKYADNPYDGEIAYVDEQIGVLGNMLRMTGLDNDTLWIITSDHGEGLGEHGETTHGIFVYDTTLHVPLILFNKELMSEPMEVSACVSLVDIMPTVMDLLNITACESELSMHGMSLVPLLAGRKEKIHDLLYFETLMPYFDYGWAGLRGVRSDGLKYIAAPEPELYDSHEDPVELDNIFEKCRATARSMNASMHDEWGSGYEGDGQAGASGIDAKTRSVLSALGYSSGAKHEYLEGDPFSGPDPKSMIWVRSSLDRGASLYMQGRYFDSVNLLEELHQKVPDNPKAPFYMGAAYLKLGKLDMAEKCYMSVLDLQPENTEALTNLGFIFGQKGRVEEAIKTLNAALALNPDHIKALMNLSIIHAQAGDAKKAEQGFLRLKEIAPNHVKVYECLGSLYANEGDFRSALEAFEEALRLDPEGGPVFLNCAKCCAELGDMKKASMHLKNARRRGVRIPAALEEKLAPYMKR